MGLIADYLEERRERKKIGFVFGIILFYIFAIFQSCSEIRYSMYGKVVEATITKVEVSGDSKHYQVTFYFIDDAKKPHKRKKIFPRDKWATL